MATGYVHGKFESIPGNETNSPTLSTKECYFPVIDFTPGLGANPLDRSDELRGVDEPIVVDADAYDPDWSMEVRGYPDVLGFLLKSLLGPPVTTAGNGVITDPDSVAIPANCWRHVWTAPYGPAGLAPQTTQFQPAYKDQSFFMKMKGAAVGQMGIESPESGGVRVKCNGPALWTDDISDPGLTPAYEALTVPCFKRGNLSLPTWLSGTATETEDFNVNIANPVEPYRSLSIASLYPDAMDKGDGPILVSGSIPKRVIDIDDWNALVAATQFTVKAKWVSTAIIASSYPYKLFLEANAQYVDGGPEGLANKRRLGATFDWEARYGGTPGSSKWTLVNATSSYA